jgi:hypothetical protein
MFERMPLGDFDAIVRLVTVALVTGFVAGLARKVFGWEGERADSWTCPHCTRRNAGRSRTCYSCSSHATVLDDPGSGQVVLFLGWVPALVAAAIGGIVAALVTWDLWPFFVVLVAASILGWLGTLGFFFGGWEAWWRHGRDGGAADRIFATTIGIGPGVATVITIIVALIWI